MSVPRGKRTLSKWEPIFYAEELHKMLIEFMQHNFGVKDIHHLVQVRYAHGKDPVEDFARYSYLLSNAKKELDNVATLMTNDLRAANSRYPTNLREYYQRRDYQTSAISRCEQMLKLLQHDADIFDVDLNTYERYVKAISREIDLIKNWRRREHKLEFKFKDGI